MKFLLKKEIPGHVVGTIGDFERWSPSSFPDFFEPIVEKKTYDDLKKNDMIFEIDYDGSVYKSHFEVENCRSETFLTREEAEDEHKRREWACRKEKFIPNEGEMYFTHDKSQGIRDVYNYNDSVDSLVINLGLAFRTHEECEKAIKEYDLINLFYKIR